MTAPPFKYDAVYAAAKQVGLQTPLGIALLALAQDDSFGTSDSVLFGSGTLGSNSEPYNRWVEPCYAENTNAQAPLAGIWEAARAGHISRIHWYQTAGNGPVVITAQLFRNGVSVATMQRQAGSGGIATFPLSPHIAVAAGDRLQLNVSGPGIGRVDEPTQLTFGLLLGA